MLALILVGTNVGKNKRGNNTISSEKKETVQIMEGRIVKCEVQGQCGVQGGGGVVGQWQCNSDEKVDVVVGGRVGYLWAPWHPRGQEILTPHRKYPTEYPHFFTVIRRNKFPGCSTIFLSQE